MTDQDDIEKTITEGQHVLQKLVARLVANTRRTLQGDRLRRS